MVEATGVYRTQLSRRTGCKHETIRYYEKIGLLPNPPRTASGYRVYPPELEQRLRFILRGRELGFEIREVRSLLELVDSHQYSCNEVFLLTRSHLDSVRKKIADLQRLEQTLSKISSQCEGANEPDCPIIDSLFGEE